MQVLQVTTAEFPPLGRNGFRWRLHEGADGDPMVSIQHNALIKWRSGWTAIVGGVARGLAAGEVTPDEIRAAVGEAARQLHAEWSSQIAEADLRGDARRLASGRISISVGGPDDGIAELADTRRADRTKVRAAAAALGIAHLAADKLEDAALSAARRFGRGRIATAEAITALSLRRPS